MATKLEEMSEQDIYAELNELEAQAQEIKAERRRLGDEIRRRSAAQQLEAKLAQFSPEERAALVAYHQSVEMAQADGKR